MRSLSEFGTLHFYFQENGDLFTIDPIRPAVRTLLAYWVIEVDRVLSPYIYFPVKAIFHLTLGAKLQWANQFRFEFGKGAPI